MAAKKILVTGGCGYVGSQVVLSLLDNGEEIVVVDDLRTSSGNALPHGVKLVVSDVMDRDVLARVVAENDVDTIIHMAASVDVEESVRRPNFYYENNIGGCLAVADVASRGGIDKIVYSSTAAIYASSSAPVSEGSLLLPASPYGRSKLAGEQIIRDSAPPGCSVAVLRYFNVAGADPQGRTGPFGGKHLLKQVARAAVTRPSSIDVFGIDYPTRDGTAVRDFVHIFDLADAHLRAVIDFREGGESFTANVGYGAGVTVLEVIQSASRCVGWEIPIIARPRRPGDIMQVVADTTFIRKRLCHWHPKYDALDTIVSSALTWETSLKNSRPATLA